MQNSFGSTEREAVAPRPLHWDARPITWFAQHLCLRASEKYWPKKRLQRTSGIDTAATGVVSGSRALPCTLGGIMNALGGTTGAIGGMLPGL